MVIARKDDLTIANLEGCLSLLVANSVGSKFCRTVFDLEDAFKKYEVDCGKLSEVPSGDIVGLLVEPKRCFDILYACQTLARGDQGPDGAMRGDFVRKLHATELKFPSLPKALQKLLYASAPELEALDALQFQ